MSRSTKLQARQDYEQARRQYPTRPALQQKLHRMYVNIASGKKTGGPARGWGFVFPRTVGERRAVYNKCGQKCFLVPPQRSKTGKMVFKYPICPRLNSGRPQCRVDPTGLQAARARAHMVHVSASRRGKPQLSRFHSRVEQLAKRKIKTTKKAGGGFNRPTGFGPAPAGKKLREFNLPAGFGTRKLGGFNLPAGFGPVSAGHQTKTAGARRRRGQRAPWATYLRRMKAKFPKQLKGLTPTEVRKVVSWFFRQYFNPGAHEKAWIRTIVNDVKAHPDSHYDYTAWRLGGNQKLRPRLGGFNLPGGFDRRTGGIRYEYRPKTDELIIRGLVSSQQK